ncbi:MAG: glycine-tRNA synthetase subunit beta [Gammaproteobacteria bacterium BRH_c0]|nr:MAG: glycine-tRNA synthetase subunit beta [Gammaproteobacteria bacterium BRH_c0]
MSADFLVEIGTEELPPKALLSLSEAFGEAILHSLKQAGLSHGEVKHFAAPRRLGLFVAALDEHTPSKEIITWGPPAKVAFDSNHLPTRAAEAFASKNGIALADLANYIENDGSQDKLCYRATSEGQPASTLLGDFVNAALASLPIPKRMRWGAKRVEFVRPVHWVVMLLGDAVIDTPVLSLIPGRISRGHRFHSSGVITIQSPASYCEDLRQAFVLADFAERRELIRQGVTQAAQRAGGSAVISDHLLDEVTALNEWPVPLVGSFEQRFLQVPAEALISSMKEHQKYFHVVDADGNLLPLFVTVANIESREPQRVIEGNEKVIRPRLSDAAFFYETDNKHSQAERREQLRTIVFQEKLGTIYDKTTRIVALAEYLAPALNANPAWVRRAGELCKSDLVSEMVMEFDDLQGVMGRYYALNDGEPQEVAEAMLEQYYPAFAGDRLPATATGTAIALADRIDTLVGIFGIGQPPSGSRDPFALRRASLGVLRILVEKKIDLDLLDTLAYAAGLHADLKARDGLERQVLTYLLERFKAWFDEDSIPVEVFMAVQAKDLTNPLEFHLRAQAVHRFYLLPEAAALAAANKRVSNILNKAEGGLPVSVDGNLFEGDEEKTLFSTIQSVSATVRPLIAARDYNRAMQEMAQLKEPVDSFFDNVMVMADDPHVRANRLCLLNGLRELFLDIADISLLAPAK